VQSIALLLTNKLKINNEKIHEKDKKKPQTNKLAIGKKIHV